MFIKKRSCLSRMITSIIALCLEIITQTSTGFSAEIPEEQISQLNQSLFDHYKNHEDFKSIALIKKDFSVEYKDIKNIDLINQKSTLVENALAFLHDQATNNSQLLATAIVFTDEIESFRIIFIYSTLIFDNSKKKFDSLNVPELKNCYLKYSNVSNLSLSEKVGIKQNKIINDNKSSLYTEGLKDCVGIVAQGIDPNNKESTLLAHFHRDQNIIDIIDTIKENFKMNDLMISLISSHYTPHLSEIIHCLKINNLTIKGSDIGHSWSHFVGEHNEIKYFILVRPLSFDPIDSSQKMVLVIPGNENVFFANQEIGLQFRV